MTWAEWAWWATLGAGVLVAVVVAVLLEWLRRTVLRVERGVDAVWTMGKRVAQNTATTHTLVTTRARGLDLLQELQLHAQSGRPAPAEERGRLGRLRDGLTPGGGDG